MELFKHISIFEFGLVAKMLITTYIHLIFALFVCVRTCLADSLVKKNSHISPIIIIILFFKKCNLSQRLID